MQLSKVIRQALAHADEPKQAQRSVLHYLQGGAMTQLMPDLSSPVEQHLLQPGQAEEEVRQIGRDNSCGLPAHTRTISLPCRPIFS